MLEARHRPRRPYSFERYRRDNRTPNAQIERAQRVADRTEPVKKQRFVTLTGNTVGIDDTAIERART